VEIKGTALVRNCRVLGTRPIEAEDLKVKHKMDEYYQIDEVPPAIL